jgi:hypothetical protein
VVTGHLLRLTGRARALPDADRTRRRAHRSRGPAR